MPITFETYSEEAGMKITKVEIMATDVPFKGHQENVGEIALGKWRCCRFVVVYVHTY